MYSSLYTADANRNIVSLLNYRENNASTAKKLKQNYQFTVPLLKRLGLEKQLDGHQGCVNCLEWSRDGRILASGSDDTHVKIWNPFQYKCLNTIQTSHIGNIFSVKFIGDGSLIATGAGDCRVIVQPIQDPERSTPHIDCNCHMGRVKRLATCPDQPLLFWSAGEDGLVLQYDIRESHKCSVKCKVFIDLSSSNELKCIAVNPTRPHLVAVGANDCYVRLYDRRMVKTSKYQNMHSGNNHNYELDVRKRVPAEQQETTCVQYYAPGHLAKDNGKDYGTKYAATYVVFNSAGNELLVNMGGEHIYLFDINNQRHVDELRVPEQFMWKYKEQSYDGSKLEAGPNCKMDTENVASGFSDRASKLVQRNWIGDMYHAARYYLRAIQHSADDPKIFLSFINCLIQLKWLKETENWLTVYKANFPNEDPKSTQAVEEALEKMRTDATNNCETHRGEMYGEPYIVVSEQEKELRGDSRDFELRFVGHCNTTTDIKEANFLGDEGNYICAGSDDGLIFIWDRKTTEVLCALAGDNSIVNCVQPHPSSCYLASSGIDPAVKLWAPMKEDGSGNPHMLEDPSVVIEVNQQRMCMDPFETMLVNMGYRVREGLSDGVPFADVSISPSQMCRSS